MSKFYGVLKGVRGRVTRTGTGKSGMEAYVASRNGAIHVGLYVTGDGTEEVQVCKTPWQDVGKSELLYVGPIN